MNQTMAANDESG